MSAPARDLIVNLIGKTNQLMGPLDGASAQMTQIGGNLTRTLTPAAAALGAGMALAGREFNGGVDAIRIGTGATGDALATMTSQMKEVSTDATLARIGLGRVGEIMADVSTRTGQTGDGLEELTTKFGQLERMGIAADVGNVARVFGDWSIATADQATVMDQLFVAAQESGASIDTLSTRIVTFGAPLRNLGFEFEEATALLAAFEKNGVNTETVMAGLKIGIGTLAKEGEAVPETFRRIVAEIENTEDASEATRLAIELFGSRAGPDLADAIRNGQFAIDDMINALANGEDTINASAEATTRLSDQMAAMKNKVVGALGPFGEFGAVAGAAVASIGPLMLGLGALPGAFAAVKAAVIGLNLTLASMPWIALGLAIAALVVLVVLNWDKIKEKIGAVWGWIKNKTDDIWGGIKSAVLTVAEFLTDLFLNWTLAGRIIKHWDDITAAATTVKDWLVEKFNEIVGFLGGIPGRIGSVLSGLFDPIIDGAQWLIDKINEILDLLPGIPSVSDLFPGFGSNNANLFENTSGGLGFDFGAGPTFSPTIVVEVDGRTLIETQIDAGLNAGRG